MIIPASQRNVRNYEGWVIIIWKENYGLLTNKILLLTKVKKKKTLNEHNWEWMKIK